LEQTPLPLTTVICRSESLLFNNIGDEVVMMDIEHGSYYGLEKVASRIWAFTEQPTSVGSVCDRLVAEYDVTPEQCRQEVGAFLSELVGRRIVGVVKD
jgi:Coenzyme PQQ synthesis protein D (PqqD)